MKTYAITLYPEKKVIRLPEGSNLFEGLRRHDVYINNACGGGAKCGKCKIKLNQNKSVASSTPEETACLTPQDITTGYRLACCIEVQSQMELEIINPESQPGSQLIDNCLPSIIRNPAVKKILIDVSPDSLKNNTPYLERIEEAAGMPFHPSYLAENLSRIPLLLESTPTKLSAIGINRQLTLVEAGDTATACYSVALDIGTTMLDAALVDLQSGKQVDTLSVLNPQRAYGIDVLSRISSCQHSQSKLKKLQQLIIKEINTLLKQFAIRADISQEAIYQLAVVGNSTMLHIFAGVNPRTIGRTPYGPIFSKAQSLKPTDCQIEISSGAEVLLLPSISAYVGADIVAGMLASGLTGSALSTIFIDVGTNGEIVLFTGSELLATSCAAGPALEGMNIACGMPALPGAIEQVFLSPKLEFRTICGGQPQGLCGSAVIDLAAEMLRCGVVDKRGKFVNKEDLLAGNHAHLARQLDKIKGEPAFIIHQDAKRQIYLSQNDFRQIQLARGAICSAICVLLTQAKLKPCDIERFIIAGRFGKSIRAESFKQLGIISKSFNGQIDYVGNSARCGAVMVLLNTDYRLEAEKLRQRVSTVELSTYPEYERILMRCLMF